MKSELVKNSVIYIAIDSAAKALIFLLWIILGWLLSPSQIGEYILSLFVIEFFAIVGILGLDAIALRFHHSEKREVLLSNMFILLAPWLILILFLFILSTSWIPSIIIGLSQVMEKETVLLSAIIVTSVIANIAIMHYVALKEISWYIKLLLTKVSLLFLSAVLLLYLGFGIRGLFIAHLLSTLGVAMLFILKEKNNISSTFISGKIIKEIVNYGAPLMLSSSLGILAIYFGRLLLDRYTDLATLGVYSFFLTLTLQINKIWTSFNQAWTPKVFSDLSQKSKKVRSNIVSMLFFVSFLYLIFLTFFITIGELSLFKLIFKEAYIAKIHLFYILLLVPLFGGIYTIGYPLYYYAKRTKRIFSISLFLAFFEILITFFLVTRYAENGATLGVLIITMLYPLIYFAAFKSIMRIPLKIIYFTLFLALFMTLGTLFLLKTSSSLIFLGFIIASTALTFVWGKMYTNHSLVANPLIKTLWRRTK